MWKPMNSKMWAFILDDEPESIYVIKGCSEGVYILVHEDAYGLSTGETEILTKNEIEERYKVTLD